MKGGLGASGLVCRHANSLHVGAGVQAFKSGASQVQRSLLQEDVADTLRSLGASLTEVSRIT